MTAARLPMPIPEALARLHADLPASVFDDAFRAACYRLDCFVGALVAELALELGLAPGEVASVESLLAQRGWQETAEVVVRWLLDTLVLYGHGDRCGAGWRLAPLTVERPSAELAADAVATLPAAAPAYEVMQRAAKALAAVLSGTCRGEEVLFNASTLALWFSYFSNDNPHYAPNNTVTAIAVARTVPAGAHLLELGGGAGSAGVAVAHALARAGKPPASYLFTELQPAFLRRGARAVHGALPPDCRLAAKVFDLNGDPGELGIAAAGLDAIVAVNTLHLATDLVPTLTRLATLLRPGGVLVLGEVMRPVHTGTVHLELPFALLDSYRRVTLDPAVRPQPGFLTVHQWRRALYLAGLAEVTVLPAAIEACATLYPGFYTAALVARR